MKHFCHPPAGAAGEARRLAIAWLAIGCAALGVSAVCAVALVAARTPYVARFVPHLDLFRPALVMHVVLSAVVWLLAYAGACASAVARGRYTVRWWLCLGAALGLGAIVASPAAGGTAVLANYVPLLDNAVFFTGLALLALGVCGSVLLVVAEGGRDGEQASSRRLILIALVPLPVALIALGWGVATAPQHLSAAAYYEFIFWGPGHALQFAYGALMIVAWLGLADSCGMRLPVTPRTEAVLVGAAVVPALAAPVIHVLQPAAAPPFFEFYTRLMEFGNGLVAVPLGVVLAWRVIRAQRSARQALLLLSIFLFLAGCLLGVLIRGESALVPAHYHGTIGAVTLACMGLAADALGAMRPQPGVRCGFRQALTYGGGLVLVVTGLAASGFLGLPRKLSWELASGTDVHAAMALIGVGGAAAIVGAGAYAWRMLGELARAARQENGRAGHFARDARGPAIVLTLAVVIGGGGLLARLEGDAGDGAMHAARPDPRLQPQAHADAQRREEIAQRFNQAVVMLHAKQYEHAMTALHRVLELAPEMPEAYVDMGYALIGLERYAAARDFFEGALALRPAQHNAYYGLAVALEGISDLPGAVGAMRTYVHLARPDDAYLRKAQSALWEWESRLGGQRASAVQQVSRLDQR